MASKLKYEDVDELFETSNRQIREESSAFQRYLMSDEALVGRPVARRQRTRGCGQVPQGAEESLLSSSLVIMFR